MPNIAVLYLGIITGRQEHCRGSSTFSSCQEVAMWSAMPNCPSMYGVALPSTPAGEGLSSLVMCYPHSTPPQGTPLWAAPQPNLLLPWVGLVGVT
ncbi:hypothetical protein Pcinc_002077 [Petrolisthes cinctipes]|uniref:Uncharacterized protein n=1 Tax=Petrolisthes cinctipes TaxID=88211 RepID=A0AAE1FFE2_PETCI|nr:hypothetical protein Pcinc_022296 [Petrolisthes cinctipes]KAK3894134.1 hypothetical protein Pcinc_002077 [Petrolisthes cinctipes]